MSAPERFWAKVDRSGDCWLWTGSKTRGGYGQFGVRIGPPGSNDWHPRRAHRIAWELTKGAPPAGLHVLHRCDNPACVNPSHLFLGTDADNVADMIGKGRHCAKRALSEADADRVTFLRGIGAGVNDLADAFGVHPATISRHLRRAHA